ncbi:hypothetical protein ACWEUB_12775 [Staphylococcus xylosus]
MTEKYNHMQSESILNDKFNNEVEQIIKEVRRGKCDSFTSTDKLILNAQKTVLETMVIDLYTKNLNTEYNNSEIDFNEYNRIKASVIEELSLNEEKFQEI